MNGPLQLSLQSFLALSVGSSSVNSPVHPHPRMIEAVVWREFQKPVALSWITLTDLNGMTTIQENQLEQGCEGRATTTTAAASTAPVCHRVEGRGGAIASGDA